MTISDLSEHERQQLRKEATHRDRCEELGLPVEGKHTDTALARENELMVSDVHDYVEKFRKPLNLDAEAAAGEERDGT